MNYPIWETTFIGGPTFIAAMSVLHVYLAHLAVGGGLFLWLTARKGYRENKESILLYVKKYAIMFVLLTNVLGAVTGVGIWFTIALVSPAATTTLIHTFVFAWAIEWVFFVGEIVAILVYYYFYDRLSKKVLMNLIMLYFVFAWLSLFVINGIIDFMLTPGGWMETGSIWLGFFNPTYLPSLFFRSFIAFTFAGLFGYVTTVYMEPAEFRQSMSRYCTKWLLWPMAGLIPSALWYFYAVPESVRRVAFEMNPDMTGWVHMLLGMTALLFVFGILLSVMKGRAAQKSAAFLLIPVGLFWMGGFEYSRENARRPYVISGYMYSNSIHKADVERLNREGVLSTARWSEVKRVTAQNKIQAGREVFNLECLACHTVNGIRNDIVPLIEKYNYGYQGLVAQLTGQGRIRGYMPPFIGTEEEKEALAAYIWTELLGRTVPDEPFIGEPSGDRELPAAEVPEFDSEEDDYVLLVWNDLGMHCISDCDEMFSFLPPANTLEAQLIRRGALPEKVTEGVELSYSVQPGHENPSSHVRFWEFADELYGADLEKNVGLAGKGLSGKFDFLEEEDIFQAKWIPVVPYSDDGRFNPYPLFTVQARDSQSGEILAETRVVAPTSTEADCYRCHGGEPRKLGAGISTETAEGILLVHDKNEGTNLLEEARAGRPKLCQSCHSDPALGAEGDDGVLNFSASMHGWHANYMTGMGDESCMYCHPIAFDGLTRCLRGVHGGGSDRVLCSQCHGTLEDMAVSLLVGEPDSVPSKQALLANIAPRMADSTGAVKPRIPWLREPDCLACHENFSRPPENPVAFNHWNETTGELYRLYNDNAVIKCIACHGSTHAIYPALNPYDPPRDVLQPLQYMGEPYTIGANMKCGVCHEQDMEFPLHHDNILRMVRNEMDIGANGP